jgi:hypothetical protein
MKEAGEYQDIFVKGKPFRIRQLPGDGQCSFRVVEDIAAAQGKQLRLHALFIQHVLPPCPGRSSGSGA